MANNLVDVTDLPVIREAKRKPPAAGKGRVKGVPNKVSATAKENVIAVFTRLGGTAAMAKWAAENQTDFYRLYAKLIPSQITGPEGGPIQVALSRIELVAMTKP